jgi:hypothetical protein
MPEAYQLKPVGEEEIVTFVVNTTVSLPFLEVAETWRFVDDVRLNVQVIELLPYGIPVLFPENVIASDPPWLTFKIWVFPENILNPLFPELLVSQFVAHLKLNDCPTERGFKKGREAVTVGFDPAGFAKSPKA